MLGCWVVCLNNPANQHIILKTVGFLSSWPVSAIFFHKLSDFAKSLTLDLMSLNRYCILIVLNSLHFFLTYWWPYKTVCIEESKNCSGWMGVHKLGNDSLMMAKIPSEAHIKVSHPASYNRHPCAHMGSKAIKRIRFWNFLFI